MTISLSRFLSSRVGPLTRRWILTARMLTSRSSCPRLGLRCALTMFSCLVASLPRPAAGDFHRGDLVPTARRAQFHGSRTHWHDLLGKHCPKFAMDHTVALPIPRPLSFREEDEYKISFSFEGDRHLTSWLTVLSQPLAELHAHDETNPVVPMIDVELHHGGGEIHKAKATTVAVSKAYLKEHEELVRRRGWRCSLENTQ